MKEAEGVRRRRRKGGVWVTYQAARTATWDAEGDSSRRKPTCKSNPAHNRIHQTSTNQSTHLPQKNPQRERERERESRGWWAKLTSLPRA